MGELTEQRVKRLRHVFGRLLIDILRLVDATRLRSGKLTSDELTIALAVVACESDGRPLTVNKLSHYLGISRTTAIRYVERMIRDGHLKRSDGRLFLAYPVDSIAVDNARRLMALINKAFSELSKMDD
jgi:predicted transcriptional regulator